MKTLKCLIAEAKKDKKNAWITIFEQNYIAQNGTSCLLCRFESLKYVFKTFKMYATPQGSEFWLKIYRSL